MSETTAVTRPGEGRQPIPSRITEGQCHIRPHGLPFFMQSMFRGAGDPCVCPRGPCSGPTTWNSSTPLVLTSNFRSGCGQQPTVTTTTRNLILSTQGAAGLSQRRPPSCPTVLAPLTPGSCLPAFPPQAAWPVLSKPALNTSAWSPGRPRGWPRALRPQLRPPCLGSGSRKPTTGPRSRPVCAFAQVLARAEQSLLLDAGPGASPSASQEAEEDVRAFLICRILAYGTRNSPGLSLRPLTRGWRSLPSPDIRTRQVLSACVLKQQPQVLLWGEGVFGLPGTSSVVGAFDPNML